MKLCLILAVLFFKAIVSASGQDTVAVPPSHPTIVCYNITELTPFCPPCPPACPNLNNCGCTFPDGTVIQPKVINYNRPPYCKACSLIRCMLMIRCDTTTPCTAAHIQDLINK